MVNIEHVKMETFTIMKNLIVLKTKPTLNKIKDGKKLL